MLYLPPKITPMGLSRRPEAFDNPDWLFEVKWDGFRALFYANPDGTCGLLSRNGNHFHGFEGLATAIARELKAEHVILDGEIVCLDSDGRANFANLFYRRKSPHFYAFDLLSLNGNDLRQLPLLERKRRLKRLCGRRKRSCLLYVDHVVGSGVELFQACCKMDLEGIVAKPLRSLYASDEALWLKIKNQNYSQLAGRDEMFEPESSPWRECDLAAVAAVGRE